MASRREGHLRIKAVLLFGRAHSNLSRGGRDRNTVACVRPINAPASGQGPFVFGSGLKPKHKGHQAFVLQGTVAFLVCTGSG